MINKWWLLLFFVNTILSFNWDSSQNLIYLEVNWKIQNTSKGKDLWATKMSVYGLKHILFADEILILGLFNIAYGILLS